MVFNVGEGLDDMVRQAFWYENRQEWALNVLGKKIDEKAKKWKEMYDHWKQTQELQETIEKRESSLSVTAEELLEELGIDPSSFGEN